MGSTAKTTSTVNPVRALLHGGPVNIPSETRVQLVSPLEEKIKLLHYGGYEHFERIVAIDTGGILEEITFHWTMRTELAE